MLSNVEKEAARPLAPPPFDSPARSCERLLEWSAPLLNDEELSRSRGEVSSFLSNEGPILQKELERLRKVDGDAILGSVPYWEDWYLSYREPLPVHTNPFYIFDPEALPAGETPVRTAARLALAAASFCLMIDRGEPTNDVLRGQPLCMKGYGSIFRVARSAGATGDFQTKGSAESVAGRSAVVLSKGRLFLLELISPEGTLRDLDETAELLGRIRLGGHAAVGSESGPPPAGLLTCLRRDDAARGRGLLLNAAEANEHLLSLVEESLFVLRLDAPCGPGLEDAARHFLFDEGVNSWHEKALQIVVTEDGWAGMNFEHSARDGTHMGPLVKAMLDAAPGISGDVSGLSDPVPVEFGCSPELRSFLEDAKHYAEQLSGSRKQTILTFSRFGREAVKRGGTSPDAFVQIAVLLAVRKTWGEWRSVYESVHMRRFAGGRTEGTRPLTPEAAAFLNALCGGERDRSLLRSLLLKAGEAHKDRIEECLSGRGVEGHLGLLREIWRSCGKELGLPAEPALFSSPAWTKLTACFVSTSTTTGEGLALAGYGPVQRGGLSARYLSREESFMFHIASWAEDGDLNDRFASALEDSLARMGELL